ncbi:MAG: hypothetical protein WD271_03320 [Acidimicrobiia bacterium]
MAPVVSAGWSRRFHFEKILLRHRLVPQEGRNLTTEPRRARRTRLAAALVTLVALPVFFAAAPAAGAAGSNSLTVKAGEYTYKFSGSPKAGWVTINFDNPGIENHMMAVVKLKKGVTAKQLKTAATSEDDSAFNKIADGDGEVYGIPHLLGPGQKTTTITKLAGGHYGVLCFVPAPDGAPHIAHGMVKTFDISTSKSSAKPPQDGVRDVTLTDSAITIPPNGIPKTGTLKVTNEGTEPHSFLLIKLESGKTIDDAYTYFNSFFETGKAEGTTPGTIMGGVATLAPNGMAYLEVTLSAGHYAYLSAEGDAPDDDYSLGLKGEFDVK